MTGEGEGSPVDCLFSQFRWRPPTKGIERVSTTLYANNLPLTATEEGLVNKFAKFGGVLSVRIERDAGGGSRRSAFVEMENAVGARRAIDGLNMANFDGRVVSVYAAVIPVAKSVAK